jgi:hypothetical protein
MDASNPFQSGLAPNLIPNPPGEIPEPVEAGDAVKALSPFSEPQDIDAVIANLTLDRPLKLYIPNKERYPQYEFRIINSIPHEIADARNKGFKEVSDPELSGLFRDLVAGTDKDGKAFRPILVARPKAVGEHIRKRNRLQLQSLYAGMDPRNKEFDGKYTGNVDAKDGTKGSFTGAGWRIRA